MLKLKLKKPDAISRLDYSCVTPSKSLKDNESLYNYSISNYYLRQYPKHVANYVTLALYLDNDINQTTMKYKNLINVVIGLILILLGYFLYFSKGTFMHYFGIIMLIYGTFVTIVQTIKLVYLRVGKFKNIWKFEDNEEIKMKRFLKEIFEFRIKNEKEITFEIPYFGLFSVINYNNKNENDFSNPQKLKNKINNFIKDEFYPIISFDNIVPIATNNNYEVLFLNQKKNEIVYLNLDDSNFKPFVLDNKLDYYLNINKLELRNGNYYYNGLMKLEQIVSDKKIFYDVSDCIYEGKDYDDIFKKCFNLLDEKINYSIVNFKDFDNKFTFELNVENQTYKNYFHKFSDYIDSERLIIVLNEILSLIKRNSENKFYLISNQLCDFGVVLANNEDFQKLKENGCIELDYKSQKINEKEKEKINKYANFHREIENIEYHIEVIKKSNKNELKKGVQYHFSYPTKYIFEEEELNIIKEKLNVIMQKLENGYEIFFIY